MSTKVCVIIGASHGGVNFAFALRKEGWQGRIILFDADPNLPYHRPPLSKAFLTTDGGIESFLLKPFQSYEKENIELRLGKAVQEVNKTEKAVILEDGSTQAYDKLVLATGARPFVPNIEGLDKAKNLSFLRTAADVLKIKKEFESSKSKKVVIIGGGYIGLEIAASLRKLGASVVVLEREKRILARVTAPEMSTFFDELHQKNGVNIQTGKQVQSILNEGGLNKVICTDGSSFTAEMIIVGVGIKVNMELALNAGIEVGNGINVDESTKTSVDDIYSIGDCTWHYNPYYERHVRLESVQNAVDQGKVAAAAICGKTSVYDALPWFWSDQYDVKLQMVGLSTGYNQVLLRKEEGHKLSAWYFQDEKLLSVDAVNNAKAYVLGTKILKGRSRANKEVLMDLETPLKYDLLIS